MGYGKSKFEFNNLLNSVLEGVDVKQVILLWELPRYWYFDHAYHDKRLNYSYNPRNTKIPIQKSKSYKRFLK